MGRGHFEDLWNREELNSNLPGNADHVSAFDLVLKDFHSPDYQNRYVVGSQFTTRCLAPGAGMKNMSTLITGQTLLKMAQDALLNWKKALAFGSQLLLHEGTLPSGNNVEESDNQPWCMKPNVSISEGLNQLQQPSS